MKLWLWICGGVLLVVLIVLTICKLACKRKLDNVDGFHGVVKQKDDDDKIIGSL